MDNLSKEEIEWLELAIEHNGTYHLVVDNDCVWIEQFGEDAGYDDWHEVFTFDNYGQEFIVQLLNYIGCHAEMC